MTPRAREFLALFAGGFLLAWILALPQLGGPGLTWDEAYYYPTFKDVQYWTGQLITNPRQAFTAAGIDAGWYSIHELPPVVKWIGALNITMGGEGWSRLAVMRIYPALAFGLCLGLLRLIARRLMPDPWAWLPVLLYALHPRIAGHAQLAATETVFAAVTLLTLWAALHDLSQRWWRLAFVACCALALATKVNGIVLVVILLWWLVTRRTVDGRLGRREGAEGWRSDLTLLGLALVGAPLMAWAIWPWLWVESGARSVGYIQFFREHIHQGIWYLGRKWNFDAPLAPVTYPLVITHLTAPVAILLLFWAGAITGLVRWAARFRKGFSHAGYLLGMLTVAPFVAASLPNTPKYDGIRLFFPVFPAAALTAGLGLYWLSTWIRTRWGRRAQQRATIAAFGLLIFALPLQRPSIDYYNLPTRLAGRNAQFFPFEQTYWGPAFTPDAVAELNEILPPGARVKTLAIHPAIPETYQQWGLLREDIVLNPEPPYDAHFIQNRRGFWGNAEWSIFLGREPLAAWGSGPSGEPLIFLYDGRPPGM